MSDHSKSDRDDPRVRELTYRLMEMAPDAPPFPEEAAMNAPESKSRPPVLVWAATAVAVVLLVGLPLILFRGGEEPTDPATTIAVPDTTTTTEPGETTVAPSTTEPVAPGEIQATYFAYLFADGMTTYLGDPALVPVERTRPYKGPVDLSQPPILDVATVLQDAITSLVLEQPEAGFSSSIPAEVRGVDVKLEGDMAIVDFPTGFESGGGTLLMTTRLAQVVFTATQFPEVDSVLFAIDGEVVDVFSGEGIVLEGPQTREDYVDVLPLIFLDTPAIGSSVQSPATLSGIANVFEATVVYEIWNSDGVRIADGFTTATCGTGCWGTFSVDVPFDVDEETLGEVVVYEESALDGSPANELRFEVTLLPGGEVPVTTTTAPSTTTTLPGEEFDIGPSAGDVVAVVGVAHDDVLNVRSGPGVEFEIVTTLQPLADEVVATGRHRLLTNSIWNEVTANGVTGWVSSRYIGFLGQTFDDTVRALEDAFPYAETMVQMGEEIASLYVSNEPRSRVAVVDGPYIGDLAEITIDVVGVGDDALLGFRLHIFAQPDPGGEGWEIKSVENTLLCGRGVTEDGECV